MTIADINIEYSVLSSSRGLVIPALNISRGSVSHAALQVVPWRPVARSDIAWNFEKFLVGPDGQLIRRYSRYMPTLAIAKDIDAALA